MSLRAELLLAALAVALLLLTGCALIALEAAIGVHAVWWLAR